MTTAEQPGLHEGPRSNPGPFAIVVALLTGAGFWGCNVINVFVYL